MLKMMAYDDSGHASEVLQIPRMMDLFLCGGQSNGLFQDGTESGIAGGNGVLKIADDETIGGEESFEDGFDGSMFFNILF
jgi:hypothetical protein